MPFFLSPLSLRDQGGVSKGFRMTQGISSLPGVTRTTLEREAKERQKALKAAGKRVRSIQRVASAPAKRSECINGPRPCPYVGCRYHLFLTVQSRGNIVFPYGEDPAALLTMPSTCALDVASRGQVSQPDVAALLKATRQRIDQEEIVAKQKLRLRAERPDA